MAREYEVRRIFPPPTLRVPAHIAYETFEYLTEFAAAGTGSDWEVARTCEYSAAGNFTVRIATKKSNPTAGDWASISLMFSLLAMNVVDIGLVFLPPPSSEDGYFEVWYGTCYTSKQYNWRAGVRLRFSTGEVAVCDENGVWQKLDTLGDIRGVKENYLEFTVDLKNKRYKQIILGGYTLDASNYGFMRYSGFYALSWVNCVVEAVSSQRARVWVDSIILKGHWI